MAPEYVVVSAENNPAKTGTTLYSRRAFRSGELIFTEKPFIIIKSQPEAQFIKNLWKGLAKDFRKENRAGKEEHPIVEAFKLLSKEDQEVFLMLFNARQKLLTRAQNHVCSRRTAPGPTSVLELLGIYLTNLQFIHDDSTAVFKNISRINHACVANAYLKWSQRRGYMEVIAAQDIPMSDVEITIDYSEKFASLIFSNAKDVRDHCCYFYGFWCRCLLCLRNIPQENSIVTSYPKNQTDDETEFYLDKVEGLILTNRAYIDTIELNAAQEEETFLFSTKRARGHISKKIGEFPSRLETLFYDFGISWRTYGGNSHIRRRLEYHTSLSQSSQNQSSTMTTTEEIVKRSPISVRNNDSVDHLRLSEANEKEDVTSRVNLETSIGKKNEGDLSIEPLTVSLGSEAESKPRPIPLSKITRRLSGENLKETTPLVHSGVNKCSVPYGTFNPIANPLETRSSKNFEKRSPIDSRSHRPRLHPHPVVPSIDRSKKGYSYEENDFSGPQVNGVGCLSSVTQNLCKFGKEPAAPEHPIQEIKPPREIQL